MYLLVCQEPVQRINARNRLAAIADNDIAFQNPSALGRTVGFNGHHSLLTTERLTCSTALLTAREYASSSAASVGSCRGGCMPSGANPS